MVRNLTTFGPGILTLDGVGRGEGATIVPRRVPDTKSSTLAFPRPQIENI